MEELKNELAELVNKSKRRAAANYNYA